MADNILSRIGDAGGKIGEALMRVSMLSDDRRYRAEQLARQGRYDERAQQRIDMDEQMLAQSVARTAELTRQGVTTDARAGAARLAERGREGYTPNLGEEGTMAEFLTGLGQGTPQDWQFDPMKSETYLDREAANTQALTQAQALAEQQTGILGTRATTLGEQGLTVSGQPLATLAAPEPNMVTMNGREFPDTPEGHAEALAWREQVEAVGGSPGLFDNDAAREAMGGGGGGVRPEEEGGNFFSKMLGRLPFGGGGEGEDPLLTPGQGVEEPVGAPGMMPQAEPTPEQMEKMQELRDQGFTEEQIEEWLRTQG